MAVNFAEQSIIDPESQDLGELQLEQYMAAIGKRIRALRTGRGMIRKDLSRRSGVSERYIAQVETGKANISVAMLWKIARSLGVIIPELFPDGGIQAGSASLLSFLGRLDNTQQEGALNLLKRRYSKSSQQIQGIALIGLRGAGKSSLGRRLARATGARFVTISELIEQHAQMSTAELFSLGGLNAYRRMEKKALDEALSIDERIVLETGGSLVTQSDAFRRLLDAYYTVWIKATPEEHMNRVLAQGDLRPMAGKDEAMEDLKLILREREVAYVQADYILDTTGRRLEDCAGELADECSKYLA